MAHTTASRTSTLPSSRPSAPTGAAQPASSVASNVRSAITASRVGRWSSVARAASAAGSSGPAASMASAPCAGAGRTVAGSSASVTAPSRPSRISPAIASTTASRSAGSSWPARWWPGTRPSRVGTFPRRSTTSRSGRAASSWAARRGDPVPTRAPGGSVSRVRPSRAHSASRGSARSGTATRRRPSGGAVGRSFIECTARSHRPANKASRSAVTKTPVPPSDASDPGSRSPSVRIRTSSIASRDPGPSASPSASATMPVWVTASSLPRVPILTPCPHPHALLPPSSRPARPHASLDGMPATAGRSPRGFAQHPARHTSYHGPSGVSAGRSIGPPSASAPPSLPV